MSLAHEAIGFNQETDEIALRRLLRSYAIVDLAVLETVIKIEGRVLGTFRSGRVTQGRALRYTGVEILAIGSSRGGFNGAGDGEDLYLVFSPASSMVSTKDRIVDDSSSKAYSLSGMKAIPVASPGQWLSHLKFDRSGNLVLAFPGSSLTFNVDSSFSYRQGDLLQIGRSPAGNFFLKMFSGSIQFYLSSDGSWYKYTLAGARIQDLQIRKTDGTRIRRMWGTRDLTNVDRADIPGFESCLYTETWNPNGSHSIIHKDSAGLTLMSDTVDSTGKRIIKAQGLEINAGTGKLKLASDTFNYSTWLQQLVSILQTISVDPTSHVILPSVVTALTAHVALLTAGTE